MGIDVELFDLVVAHRHEPDQVAVAPAAVETLGRTLAVDPPSVAQLGLAVAPEFRALAAELAVVFAALDRGNVDEAAVSLNRLLARHPAYPHLTREDGGWRLHHHPADAARPPRLSPEPLGTEHWTR